MAATHHSAIGGAQSIGAGSEPLIVDYVNSIEDPTGINAKELTGLQVRARRNQHGINVRINSALNHINKPVPGYILDTGVFHDHHAASIVATPSDRGRSRCEGD